MTLARACAEHDIVCEGAWGPRDEGDPGRAYFAVPATLTDREVMRLLRAASLPCDLIQIHPAPTPAKKRVANRPAPTKPAAKKPAAKKPAAKKPAPTKPAATTPAKRRGK